MARGRAWLHDMNDLLSGVCGGGLSLGLCYYRALTNLISNILFNLGIC